MLDAEDQPTGWRRRLPSWLVWIIVAVPLLWAMARLFGLDWGIGVVQLLAFTPYALLAALIPLALALVTRRWPAAGVAGVAVALLAGCVVPRALGSPTQQGGVALRVMAANLRVGEADPTAIVGHIRAAHIDVLALQELSPAALTGLTAAGLSTLLPYREVHPIDGVEGSAVFARFPLTGAAVKANPGGGFTQMSATIQIPGAPAVVVESVHPAPPLDSLSREAWSAGLRGQSPASVDGPLRILAGDFNATLDHVELRQLIATGYLDAADAVGAGLTPTWPYYGPRSTITPKVTIDHVLVDRRIGVRDFAAHTIARSDHRAIMTTLLLPAA